MNIRTSDISDFTELENILDKFQNMMRRIGGKDRERRM